VPRCPMNRFCETFNIISGLKHQKPNNLDFFFTLIMNPTILLNLFELLILLVVSHANIIVM